MPGDGPVFVSFSEEVTTTTTALTPDSDSRDHGYSFQTSVGTENVRTYVVSMSPSTGEPMPLAWVAGEMEPFYWDAQRSTLWVLDKKTKQIVGVSPRGTEYPPWGEYVANLTPPFASERGLHYKKMKIWNAASRAQISIELDRAGDARIDGSLLRMFKVVEIDGAVQIKQTVIDWSNPEAPVRLADIDWQTPPLAGTRLVHTVTSDGRRYVEVVQVADGKLLVSQDMLGGAPETIPLQIGDKLTLEPAGRSLVIAHDLEENTEENPCWQGQIVDVRTKQVTPLAADGLCVTDVVPLPGSQLAWFKLGAGKSYGYYDPTTATITPLAALTTLTQLGPTTVGFARLTENKWAIEQLDLATGTLTRLAERSKPPVLIHLDHGALVIVENDQIQTPSTGASFPVPAEVGAGPRGVEKAYEVAGIADRPERNKLWIGMAGGVSTKQRPAGGGFVQIRRWMDRRWALSVGAGLHTEDAADDRFLWDIRATFGGLVYLRPSYGGWYAGSELGLGTSALRDRSMMEVTTIDTDFAPSISLQGGYQGRLLQLNVKVEAPSFIDPDRGLSFMAGFGFGLLGNNL